jgi:hypothetical protein
MKFLNYTTTILGQLEIIEVYDFYDKPVLFSCKNSTGLIFIALYVDSSDFAEVWLYAPVSESRFQSLIKGSIKLKDIFTKAQDGYVYQVEVPYKDCTPIVKTVECNKIPEDYLPLSESKLF